MKNILEKIELRQLDSVIGSTFQSISGPHLTISLESEQILLETDSAIVMLQGVVEFLAIDAGPDEFSRIQVSTPELDLVELSKTRGNIFIQHRGEKIKSISLGRDLIEKSSAAKVDWVYEVDTALYIELESCVLRISLISYHAEVLKVSYLDELTSSSDSETSGRFNDDVLTRYSTQHSLFRIADLLGENSDN
jgi:hypothetical protein